MTVKRDWLVQPPPVIGAPETGDDPIRSRMLLFLQAYELSLGNVSKSCAAIQIARQTYYDWMSGNNERCRWFRAELAKIKPKEFLLDVAEDVVVSVMARGQNKDRLAAAKLVLGNLGTGRGWNAAVKTAETAETPIEQEVKPLVDRIDLGSRQNGRTWREECLVFLDIFEPTLRPEVVDELRRRCEI